MKTFLLSLVLAGAAMAQYLPPAIGPVTATVTGVQYNYTTTPLDSTRIQLVYQFWGTQNLCFIRFGRNGNDWQAYGQLFSFDLGRFLFNDGSRPQSNNWCQANRAVSSESPTARSITVFADMTAINMTDSTLTVYSITDGAINVRVYDPASTTGKPRTAERVLSYGEGMAELMNRTGLTFTELTR